MLMCAACHMNSWKWKINIFELERGEVTPAPLSEWALVVKEPVETVRE